MPGHGYDAAREVDITVLLPTFRRAKNGLFERAVESVLLQTHKNLELIIIDDASTDGTALLIEKYMKKDGRVSCLRHPKNIGLPAISEYEGLKKARGRFISFAFDDDFFYDHALSELLEYAEEDITSLVYGHVEMHARQAGAAHEFVVRLGENADPYNIDGVNFISNNAVLMPRHIIAQIGFYDPHILMTRLCDWDLWRRVAMYFRLKYVPVAVGEITGPSSDDSLGKTYLLDAWSCDAWMRSDRNEALLPSVFEDYDVFSCPNDLPTFAYDVIQDAARNHAEARQWPEKAEWNKPSARKSVLVVSSSYHASTTLYFDYLSSSFRQQVRVILKSSPLSELARASCLVVIRSISEYKNWIDCAKILGIPVYLFVDDNFTELQSEMRFHEDWTLSKLRKNLESFSGVLSSSPKLSEYYQEHLLHKNILPFPPVVKKFTMVARRESVETKHPFTIGVMAGSHRFTSLKLALIPALNRLAADADADADVIRLVVCGVTESQVKELQELCSAELRLVCLPFVLSWRQAMIRLSDFQPDIIVHPDSDSINSPYKTDNVAVTAWVTGGVLVAPDVEPYSEMAKSGNAILISKPSKPLNWYDGCYNLYRNPELRELIKSANNEYCMNAYSGIQTEATLTKILAEVKPLNLLKLDHRYKTICEKLSQANESQHGVTSLQIDAVSFANEVAELRGILRNSKRQRMFRKSGRGLWSDVSPEFNKIKEYLTDKDTKGLELELSEVMNNKEYLEYNFKFEPKTVDFIDVAFSLISCADGYVGIEVVTPRGEVLRHEIYPIAKVHRGQPIRFHMNDMKIVDSDKPCLVRLFGKADCPIYSYEMVKYSLFGLRRLAVVPFFYVKYK